MLGEQLAVSSLCWQIALHGFPDCAGQLCCCSGSAQACSARIYVMDGESLCSSSDRTEAQTLAAAAELIAAARAAAVAESAAAPASAATASAAATSPADDAKEDCKANGGSDGAQTNSEMSQQPPKEARAALPARDAETHLQAALEAICCMVTNGLEVSHEMHSVLCIGAARCWTEQNAACPRTAAAAR